MADNETPTPPEDAAPPREPAGPGPLMAGGFALLIVAAWCGHDAFYRTEEYAKKGTAWYTELNAVFLLVALLGSAYCFIQAYIRNKKMKAAGGPKKPDDPTLL
jgi:hypothetical protein